MGALTLLPPLVALQSPLGSRTCSDPAATLQQWRPHNLTHYSANLLTS